MPSHTDRPASAKLRRICLDLTGRAPHASATKSEVEALIADHLRK